MIDLVEGAMVWNIDHSALLVLVITLFFLLIAGGIVWQSAIVECVKAQRREREAEDRLVDALAEFDALKLDKMKQDKA